MVLTSENRFDFRKKSRKRCDWPRTRFNRIYLAMMISQETRLKKSRIPSTTFADGPVCLRKVSNWDGLVSSVVDRIGWAFKTYHPPASRLRGPRRRDGLV